MAKGKSRVSLNLNIEDIKRAVAGGLEDAMWEAGQVVAGAIVSRAPRDTGGLAESVYVATEKRSTYKSAPANEKERTAPQGGVVVGVAKFTAHFIESGTSITPARPFVRPAFTSTKERAAQVATEKLAEAIR